MRCPRCRAKTRTYNHKLKFIGSSQKPHEVCDNQDADDEAKQQLSIHNEKYRQESHGTAGHALAIRLSIHISVGMQEEHPKRAHSKPLDIGAMYVDKHPVTNAEYAEYVRASAYAGGKDAARWLMQSKR